jgi:DNA-binding LacI/PurR family transcriptional regulator
MKESRTVAFAMHAYHNEFSVDDLFVMEILGSISKALSLENYDLLIAHVDPYDTEWPHQYLDTGRVDGFILMTSTRKQHHIKALLEMEAPFIAWGIPSEGHNYCSVTGDNFNGGRLATEHLLGLGRRKIAFIGGPEYELEVQGRLDGYKSALQAADLEINTDLIAYGDYRSASGAESMQQLLEQAPDLDAVFIVSDLMAPAAMEVLHERGRSIPDDVAVVGYDNLSVASTSNPPLTTVSQNLPFAGKLIAKNLIENIQTSAVTNSIVPVELIKRRSA